MNLAAVLKAISPEIRGGGSASYSLRLPKGTSPLMQFVHYGVQPAVLIKNIFDTKKSLDTLGDMSPDKLQQMGFSKKDSDRIYRRQRGAVVGKALGDMVSWGLYPLAFRNPLLHYPLSVGASVAAPRLGEWMGKQVS